MCRIASYLGPAIPLENIIVRPKHSLLTQSHAATEAKLAVNGDGFGIAWYSDDLQPGVYRDVMPAWADENLTSLCRMVKSHLFIAHVRASTIGTTSRANCHPFTHKGWSFVHNGQVPHIQSIRRTLEAQLPDQLYQLRGGTTDSELIFLTLLANGLNDCPRTALQTTIRLLGKSTSDGPIRLTCVLSDGHRLIGFRYASDNKSPTLYSSNKLDNDGISLASEPLDGCIQNWARIAESTMITIDANSTRSEPIFDQSSAIHALRTHSQAPLSPLDRDTRPTFNK
ncbi:class II glutamine amidotransferase [Parasulfitobacter algicola]|uniref:Class II glutamine amidotransferase n=1 Tax=Parasulfitobacter algicola TaxID=2614809 RepID=A0ABX2IRU3_9RHOB|nr:class II glutamine amidotransferase [Sulfitobacter algicola]NSX53815.1 class II glutamine amidotransferase [Sulfitobacter algicola]